MGLFSIFRKHNQDEIIASVAQDVLTAAISAQDALADANADRAPYIGAEIAHLFIHLIDRQLFEQLDTSRRDDIYDQLIERIITVYSISVFQKHLPQMELQDICKKMLGTLNSRQVTYSKCNSLLGDEFPAPGSMIFAFCFFRHQILGKTTKGNVDKILCGESQISLTDDLTDFPDIESLLRASVFVGVNYTERNIAGDIKRLR